MLRFQSRHNFMVRIKTIMDPAASLVLLKTLGKNNVKHEHVGDNQDCS
jgi:hypothetical protein